MLTKTLGITHSMRLLEAVAQRCSVKKLSLEITQNSQENTRARVSFLIKLTWSTHYTPELPSYRKQPIDLQSKSIDWFLYDSNFGV